MTATKAWLAAALLPLAAPALAQSVDDFRLQPASPSPSLRPAGPTDRDAPVVRAATPAAPSATPTVTTTPRPLPTVKPSPTPSAKPSAKPSPSPSPTEEETPSPEPTTPAPVASAPSEEPTYTHTATAMPEPEPNAGASGWWWALLPAALIALAATWFATWRRDPEEEEPEEPAPDEAELIAPWGGPPQPLPPAPPIPPTPAWPRPAQRIVLALEPVRMTATIVSALFAYRLVVTNAGRQPLGPLHLAGSMIGAHASLPVEQQLGIDGQILELLHEVPALAPGETRVVQGEMRLPLNLIDPIHAGEALLFVPIARFRAQGEGVETLAAFVVGETPPVTAGALLPFRLDLGPRVWAQVSARRLEMPVAN